MFHIVFKTEVASLASLVFGNKRINSSSVCFASAFEFNFIKLLARFNKADGAILESGNSVKMREK